MELSADGTFKAHQIPLAALNAPKGSEKGGQIVDGSGTWAADSSNIPFNARGAIRLSFEPGSVGSGAWSVPLLVEGAGENMRLVLVVGDPDLNQDYEFSRSS